MTVVEFVSSDAAKNWVATWVHSPEKVILIGDEEQMLQTTKKRYQAVADAYGRRTHFTYQVIPLRNASEIFKALEDVLQENGECLFDLLGGSEWYLAYGHFPTKCKYKKEYLKKMLKNA